MRKLFFAEKSFVGSKAQHPIAQCSKSRGLCPSSLVKIPCKPSLSEPVPLTGCTSASALTGLGIRWAWRACVAEAGCGEVQALVSAAAPPGWEPCRCTGCKHCCSPNQAVRTYLPTYGSTAGRYPSMLLQNLARTPGSRIQPDSKDGAWALTVLGQAGWQWAPPLRPNPQFLLAAVSGLVAASQSKHTSQASMSKCSQSLRETLQEGLTHLLHICFQNRP
jgi:hypothetical protein